LLFENGKPEFVKGDTQTIFLDDKVNLTKVEHHGHTLQLAFTELIGDPAYYPANAFDCRLKNENGVYSVHLIESVADDEEYFLFQKYSVLEFIKELNIAISSHHAFEFDAYQIQFNNLYYDRFFSFRVSNDSRFVSCAV
jgi:hypothetical protein